MSFKCKPLKTERESGRVGSEGGKHTHRTQLADIPAEILGHGHHLVNNRIHFGSVQDSVAVRVVEAEHDCNNEWMSGWEWMQVNASECEWVEVNK